MSHTSEDDGEDPLALTSTSELLAEAFNDIGNIFGHPYSPNLTKNIKPSKKAKKSKEELKDQRDQKMNDLV